MPATRKKSKEEKTLDEMFSEIDVLIASMESKDISLEDSFEQYKKGIELIKQCNDRIEYVDKQVKILDEEGNISDFQ